MRKYGASAALVAIVALILGAALWVGTGGIGHKSAAAKAVTHTALPANCIRLESGGVKLCTTDTNARSLASRVADCVQKNGAATCGQALQTALQQACLGQGYKGPGCQRDGARITALVEAVLTGNSIAAILKPTGLSADG